MRLSQIPVSILDRANAREGQSEIDALHAVVDRAQRAEKLGYHRFWVAEHHGVPGIAGSAPTLLMASIAARTERIRVGCGGVMLPNHQPLVVAEQTGTLEALYPGRIDLGLGRSVGFTPAVRAALRQDKEAAGRFEADLAELLSYLSGAAAITARPFNDSATPAFVLATGQGIDIAARAGLAVVLGGPVLFDRGGAAARQVLDRYHENFRPSSWFQRPLVLISANIAVAESTGAARTALLSEAWAMAQARTRGEFPPLPPPAQIQEDKFTARERSLVEQNLAGAIYGTAKEVAGQLEFLLDRTAADELLVSGAVYDAGVRVDSDARLAALFRPDEA